MKQNEIQKKRGTKLAYNGLQITSTHRSTPGTGLPLSSILLYKVKDPASN